MVTGTPDPFPERADAVRVFGAELGWDVSSIRLVSLDARGNSFVTGHAITTVDARGTVAQRTVYLEGEIDDPGAGVTLESTNGERLTAWLYPADPALPALARAVDPEAAADLVSRLGADPAGLSVSVLSYRPGKRAVVRASSVAATVFLKIVTPARVEQIRTRHTVWREHGIPVPAVRSWSEDGLLVLDPLEGAELIGMLDRMPDDGELVASVHELSRRIASVPSTTRARPSLARRLDWYRGRLGQLCPDNAEWTHAVCERIALTLAASPTSSRPVTIHGDLHLAQLFASPDDATRITGVLDIDTAGLGDPADDSAAIVGHLLASADLIENSSGAEAAGRVRRLAFAFVESWNDHDDRGHATRARAIAATHLLGHGLSGSLGPSRCLELAEGVLAG